MRIKSRSPSGFSTAFVFWCKEGLVGRSAAFLDEGKFIFKALAGIEFDLRRKVGGGVDFFKHAGARQAANSADCSPDRYRRRRATAPRPHRHVNQNMITAIA